MDRKQSNRTQILCSEPFTRNGPMQNCKKPKIKRERENERVAQTATNGKTVQFRPLNQFRTKIPLNYVNARERGRESSSKDK